MLSLSAAAADPQYEEEEGLSSNGGWWMVAGAFRVVRGKFSGKVENFQSKFSTVLKNGKL